ncbi:Non-hem dioxygenase N-terminal domain-containing protein [Hirschfeldia incana]|nr:Non-hem dioxygenase N-terminal domain-containing protein [Hirschfeldia incana]
MSEMETKTQVEDSIIQESLLTCIDLTNSDLHQSVILLKQACLDSGFFYVINHGISEEVMDKAFEQSKKFFALPLEEKMKVLKNEKHRGYTPFYDQIPDPENQVQGDNKEGYYIGSDVPRDDPQWDYPFYGPNPWPDPDVLPGWRETMEKNHQEALRVCKAIAKLLALALDLDAYYFDSPEMLGKPISTLRLLHYEGKSDPSKGIYGTGAHSDYGMMTLIATDGVMGLQICKDKNAKPQKWEYVPSIEGAIVVNLGDMMQCWSNGLFRFHFSWNRITTA